MGRTLEQVLAKLPAARRAKIEARVAEIIAEEKSLQDLRKAMNWDAPGRADLADRLER